MAKRLFALLCSVMILFGVMFSVFAEIEIPFEDVKINDWYYDAVRESYEKGLFTGVSDVRFEPETAMTRAMFVTVLAAMTKVDTKVYTEQHFLDTAPGQWYTPYVEWAAHWGIVAGTGKFTFSPNTPITREQMAQILYRYSLITENDITYNADISRFSDFSEIASYALNAVSWVADKGLMTGMSKEIFSPKTNATRAQAAQVFCNFEKFIINKEIKTAPAELPVPDRTDKIIYNMTLEEKIGQLFLPRCPQSNAQALISKYHPCGYTLYRRDFENKTVSQVQAMINSYQSAADIPMFIAVDEEGGSVVRISSNPNLSKTPFKSQRDVYLSGGIEGIRSDTSKKARLLLSLGVNLNLAPVCDVSVDPSDYIYPRTFGLPAPETSKAISVLVETMNEENLSGALKHFPGYGSNLNTHNEISIDTRSKETFYKSDFLPFIAGIESGAPSILVSHNIVCAFDSEKPASLSKPIHDLLREELNFNGVIMTDDLSMDAIKQYTNGRSPALAAFLCGNDLLLTSDWEQDYNSVLSAAKRGEISINRIEQSLRRIIEWKEEKGLLN